MPSPLAPLLASAPVQGLLNYTLRPLIARLGLSTRVAQWRHRGLRTLLLPRFWQLPLGTPAVVRRMGIAWQLDPGECHQWKVWSGTPEEATQVLAPHLAPGTLVLDIGANLGQVSLQLAHTAAARGIGPEALAIWAFEPNPASLALLETNLALNPALQPYIRVWPVGLSDAPGHARLATPDAKHSGLAHVSATGAVEIELARLDDLLARDAVVFEHLLIKADVEGHELHVLRGAAHTLRTHRPTLVLEVADSHLRRARGSAAELISYLRDLGYTEFLDVATNRPAPTDPAHLNGVFMNLLAR
ncbi:MAG: FkbM family methyltransferase [Bacteroidia bacterium]|nr:FkbM family methyltransferase [Bacteroidia bacterium]